MYCGSLGHKPFPKRENYGWTETRDAHVYKVEAEETDKVAVNFAFGFGPNFEISVTLKKDENASRWEPTQGFSYPCVLPQNANAKLVTTVIENGVLSVTFPKIVIE